MTRDLFNLEVIVRERNNGVGSWLQVQAAGHCVNDGYFDRSRCSFSSLGEGESRLDVLIFGDALEDAGAR